MDVSRPWCAYARLQIHLRRRSRLNDQTWGIEAGLNNLLDNFASQADPGLAVEIGRARERHRRVLRTRFLLQDDEFDPKPNLDDREALRSILKTPDPIDRSIAHATALGHASAEIGAALGLEPAAVRKRLDRLRARLKS